jgi:hypothetical protein
MSARTELCGGVLSDWHPHRNRSVFQRLWEERGTASCFLAFHQAVISTVLNFRGESSYAHVCVIPLDKSFVLAAPCTLSLL